MPKVIQSSGASGRVARAATTAAATARSRRRISPDRWAPTASATSRTIATTSPIPAATPGPPSLTTRAMSPSRVRESAGSRRPSAPSAPTSRGQRRHFPGSPRHALSDLRLLHAEHQPVGDVVLVDVSRVRRRLELRGMVESALVKIWPSESARPVPAGPSIEAGRTIYDTLQKLAPRDEEHRTLKTLAVQVMADAGQLRWMLFELSGSAIPVPLLAVVGLWLALIFASFALFAPSNGTAIAGLLIGSLSVAGAIFLILELDHPFSGMIRV